MKMYTSKDASNRKYNLYVRLEKDKKDYLSLDELEDFPKEEAEKRARQYCDKLGITGIGDVIEYIDVAGMTANPSIGYVLGMYVLLIAVLTFLAVFFGRKQEIIVRNEH